MALIIVSGFTGAGKTLLSQKLADKLKYKEFYMGGVIEAMAKTRSLSKKSFYEAMKSDPELEKGLDGKQAELIAEADNMVIQGRITPFIARGMIPGLPTPKAQTISFLLTIASVAGAMREKNRPENNYMSLVDMIEFRKQRALTERQRYLELYGITNHLDPKYFDETIDTSYLSPDEMLAETLHRLQKYNIYPI